MAEIREISLSRTAAVDQYRDVDGAAHAVLELAELGSAVSEALPGRVWMLNSTAAGGGVAEMMPRLCSLMNDVGVHTRWLVLDPGDPEFFKVTKALHNMLHGAPGIADLAAAARVYHEVSADAAARLRPLLESGDILVVHDPQPLGAAALLPAEHSPARLWRCHIGVPFQNEHTRAAWALLRDYLAPFKRLLFSAEAYIPDDELGRSGVLHPSIDPLSHKNRVLRTYKLVGILRAAGLVEGPACPDWSRFDAPAFRFTEDGWVSTPIPALLHTPIVLQVSRFDRLKGFDQLIPAFEQLLEIFPARVPHLSTDTERAMSELACTQLVLAGPDPQGVADDPEAADVLDSLCRQFRSLPREVAARVHVVRLPMVNAKQNALAVNALQRIAAVVVQNSLQEGFGLTVSEALWKSAPVVASNVGGLGVQIRHRTDGLLVDDPRNPRALAECLLEMLAYPKRADTMARSGRNRVRDHFLVLSQVRAWLLELQRLVGAPAAQAPPAARPTPAGGGP